MPVLAPGHDLPQELALAIDSLGSSPEYTLNICEAFNESIDVCLLQHRALVGLFVDRAKCTGGLTWLSES